MPSSDGRVERAGPLREAPLVAAARLLAERGVYGLAWAGDDLVVTATYGALASFIAIGEPLTECVPALFGLDGDIRALRNTPGATLNLPAVSIVSHEDGAPKLNILVLWSPADEAFLVVVSRAVPKGDLEFELSQQIRARLMAEAALKEKSVELSRANRDLEEYAGIISHDLKAPLRAMRYLASDLERTVEAGQAEETRTIVVRLREQSQRMSAMLSALLDYSSIGRKAEAIGTVDTLRLVKDILNSVPHPPGMRIELHGEWPVIETLEAPLDIVLRNLIGNAIAHHDREDGVVRVIAMEGNASLEFTIADDGPGIPLTSQAAIFLPFRRLDSENRSGGQGMGLSYVKRILESVNGRIEVSSDPDQRRGTSFRVLWPKKVSL